jgi:hypothetical protein
MTTFAKHSCVKTVFQQWQQLNQNSQTAFTLKVAHEMLYQRSTEG